MSSESLDVPILSVIIVAYKSRDEIGPNLDSLPRKLADRDVEVIVVDNYPVDGTTEFVRKHYPWVKCINPETNLGFGRANNIGYASSRGENLLFLNPDTVTNNQALDHCLGRLKENPTIGLISPRLVLLDGTLDQACRRGIPTVWDGFCRASGLSVIFSNTAFFSGYNLTHLPIDGTYEVGAINGAFMLSPRRVTEKIAPDGKVFDENFFMYGDDLDLCIRVARSGLKIIYDGRFSIVHLKGTSVEKDFEAMSKVIFDANRDVYLKHFNRDKSLLVRWKYEAAFGAWKQISLLRARLRSHRKVRPV